MWPLVIFVVQEQDTFITEILLTSPNYSSTTARSFLLLNEFKFTHILSVSSGESSSPLPDPQDILSSKHINIKDDPTEDIIQHLKKACDWIQTSLASTPTNPKRVLIHSTQGVSRAGAIVIAYRTHHLLNPPKSSNTTSNAISHPHPLLPLRSRSSTRVSPFHIPEPGVRAAAPGLARMRVQYLHRRPGTARESSIRGAEIQTERGVEGWRGSDKQSEVCGDG